MRNIIYRSSWELRFLQWCDSNDNIIEYASEEFSIPYLSPLDNRPHRYYPDFLIKVKESGGVIKKYVIEVKPKRQTQEPKRNQGLPNLISMNVKRMPLTKPNGNMPENSVKITL